MKFYGKIGFPKFEKRIEQDFDYDVFLCDIDDEKTSITDLENADHFNNIDTCIMWAVLWVMEGKLHDGMHIVIQIAKDFEKKYPYETSWNRELDYIEEIEKYAEKKLMKEFGN